MGIKIFSWMQSKLTGKQGIRKEAPAAADTNQRQDSRREEFSDWPHGLLAIGTFGNENDLKQEADKSRLRGTNSTSEDHLQGITPEEVNKLQKEIAQILDKQQGEGLSEAHNPSSDNNLKDDHRSNNNTGDEQSTSVVLNKEKDIRADQTKGSIGKKSLTFIFKNMLVCRSGFAITPNLRDPIPDKSRMEKILRAILNKKIHPQSSNPKYTANVYLDTNHSYDSDSDDEMFNVENEGSKWVKTDSDYIVLEI